MRVKRRTYLEEYLYRRAERASRPELEQPPDPKRPVNLILRYLGILLPIGVSYGLGLFYFGAHNNSAGFWAAKCIAAAIWLGFAAALGVRRDWAGVGAITGIYIFFDAWMWVAVSDRMLG